ncbi:MAG: DinB family protein [Chitinophagales bacterium]
MANLFKENLTLALQTRRNFQSILESSSIAELNAIPIGFNNNVVWNIGHIVATMDIIFYTLNGLIPKLYSSFIESYRKGTKPAEMFNQAMVDTLNLNLISQLERIEIDVKEGIFPQNLPKAYTTSYNFELKTLDDIIRFNQVHEALHMGIVMSLRKFV